VADRADTQSPALAFGKGAIGGVGAGMLVAMVPIVGAIGLVLALLMATRIALRQTERRVEVLVVGSGFMLGLGALLLYGSWNVITACRETSDFCGDANVVPLLVGAIVVLVVGGAGTLWSLRVVRQ
jgi:hypothetical protein